MTTINEQIRAAMSKAFFASAWADMQEEKEDGVNLSGCEIMDVMPEEIDPAAIHAASTLAMDLESANPFCKAMAYAAREDFLSALFAKAQACERTQYADRELTPENFGHYLAMQAMGHGVGLSDAFGDAVYQAIKVSYVEFGMGSLEKDY